MTSTREPAVAGLFYPQDPTELSTMVNQLLREAPISEVTPKALIVPHAGYIYSGTTAAAAYKTLINQREKIRKVVLLGPSHHVAFQGIAYSEAQQFTTPLGAITQNIADITHAQKYTSLEHNDSAHQSEHSLEVQLPFLQCCLNEFSLIALVVGDASIEHVSNVLEQLWGDDETLIIISTDLSHYHTYHEAQLLDRITSDAIEQLDSHHISAKQACGFIPLLALLEVAKMHHLNVTKLALCNSGDTAGTHDRVVGYGAYALQ